MATLDDAIKVWQDAEAKRIQKLADEQAKKIANMEAETEQAFEALGLKPNRISGHSALFQFDGREIQFNIVERKYKWLGFYLVLGECPKCKNKTFTDELELTLENIGWSLSEPQKRYHECWGSVEDVELKPLEKSNAERLVEVLNDLIDVKISSITFE